MVGTGDKTMLYAVDLDGTLCEENHNVDATIDWQGYYRNAVPYTDAITRINRLFDAKKHTIIIYTARWEEDREITRTWLQENGVKYNLLIMGKLRADIYIDNDSMRINEV